MTFRNQKPNLHPLEFMFHVGGHCSLLTCCSSRLIFIPEEDLLEAEELATPDLGEQHCTSDFGRSSRTSEQYQFSSDFGRSSRSSDRERQFTSDKEHSSDRELHFTSDLGCSSTTSETSGEVQQLPSDPGSATPPTPLQEEPPTGIRGPQGPGLLTGFRCATISISERRCYLTKPTNTGLLNLHKMNMKDYYYV